MPIHPFVLGRRQRSRIRFSGANRRVQCQNNFSGKGNLADALTLKHVTVKGEDRAVAEMRVFFDEYAYDASTNEYSQRVASGCRCRNGTSAARMQPVSCAAGARVRSTGACASSCIIAGGCHHGGAWIPDRRRRCHAVSRADRER